MSFSSGTFTLSQPNVVTGATISSSWANSVLEDIATNGLTLCLLKNGTQTVTANIPFSGFRLTGIGAPIATNDALREGSAIGATTPAAGTFNSGSMTGLTALAIRDTSAAFDVTLAAVSSAALTAGRTLTLNMGNVAHTLAFGTTANTITFPNAASGTVPFLNLAQTFSAAQTFESAFPQLTLGVLNTTAGAINFKGSTSGNVTLKGAAAAGASVTVTLPATSVTLNAAGDLTGNTLNSSVVTSSLTTVGALNSGSITNGFGSIDVGADAISGGAGSFTTGTFTSEITAQAANNDIGKNGSRDFLRVSSQAAGGGADLQFLNDAISAFTPAVITGSTITLKYASSGLITTTGLSISTAGAVSIPGTLGVTGAVSIGNTLNSVSPTSPNRTITMVVGGTTVYIAAKTTND